MRKLLYMIGMALIILWLSTSVVAVYPAQSVVITRLGRPVRVISTPGPAVKLPWPFESALSVEQRLHITEISPLETLTKDKKNLVLSAFAVWRVREPLAFLSTVKDPRAADVRIGDMVSSLLGNEVATLPLGSLISVNGPTRVKQLNSVLTRTVRDRAIKAFGIEVLDVMVSRMVFPDDNLRHVFNRMRAERERIAKKYRAEGEEKAMEIMSKTDLEVRRILSEARLKAMEIQAKAQSEALALKAEAYKKDPEFYKFFMELQTLKETIKKGGRLILSTRSGLFRLLEEGAK